MVICGSSCSFTCQRVGLLYLSIIVGLLVDHRRGGGLGILDIKTEGGLSQLKEFRRAIYRDSEPGTRMISSLKYSQIESGLALHLMEDPKLDHSDLAPDVASVPLDHDHVLRCPAQKCTRYLALQDIRGTIAETRSPAGPLLWQGLKHWLSNTSEPLSINTSRYSVRKI